jgi:hypothetical protein
VNTDLQAYCEADVKLTERLFQYEMWLRSMRSRIRRIERDFLEHGIIPVSLHDDSRNWGP